MNLHNIVAPCVSAVNPWTSGLYQASAGYTTNLDGSRAPAYADAIGVEIQMQALSYRDLQQISGLNLNGEARAMYINGNFVGVDRAADRGGDLITLPVDGTVWLIVHVLENWNTTSGWTKFAVTKQNGS